MYEEFLSAKLHELRSSGQYREFVDINRQAGAYPQAVYDTPTWDADYLRIWRRGVDGEEVLHEVDPRHQQVPDRLRTIVKLRRLVADVLRFVQRGEVPQVAFAGLTESVELQQLLNTIEEHARVTGPACYFPDGRTVASDTDWERLG
ncbi:hypothetical protein ACWD5Q_28425 [Streptomyces sp. NPDC002513]